MNLLHQLATLAQAEQRRLVSDFIDDLFEDRDGNPEFMALMRSAEPELGDDPTPEQVEAWVELVGLCQNADFRDTLRRMAEDQAGAPAPQDISALHSALNRVMGEYIEEAVSAGLLPASVKGEALGDSLGNLYAHAFERAGESDLRRWLLARLRATADPQAERYWQLLATISGWPASPAVAPVHSWFTAAFATGDVAVAKG